MLLEGETARTEEENVENLSNAGLPLQLLGVGVAVRTEAKARTQPRAPAQTPNLQVPRLVLDDLLRVYCFGGLYVKGINFYLLPGIGLLFL